MGKTIRGSEAARVLEQPPPDVFELTLPATVSNGVPGAGAGNLETTASGDVYEFATAVAGGLRIGGPPARARSVTPSTGSS